MLIQVLTINAQMLDNMLEHRDRNGQRVYVFRLGRWDPDIISVYDVFCGLIQVLTINAQ